MNNKPILFIDFYKTLNHDVYWRSLNLIEREKIQDLLFRNDTALVHDWMRGKYTAEKINKIIADKLNIPYERLWNIFVQDSQTMKIPSEILDSINNLRNKYFVILLTGNMDSFTRFTQPALQLENYFDLISNSFEEGAHKTDNNGGLFLKYAKRYNVDIKDCISLDDSEKVYQIFTQLGGIAYLVNNAQNISYYLEKLSNN